MKTCLSVLLSVSFFAGSAGAQQKFEPTLDSRRQAIVRGQVKEYLAAMEVLGSEAERKEGWAEASEAYGGAAAAARRSGQLQRALSYATKAIEMAQRTKDPRLQTAAIKWLADAYKSLGQFEKEREWRQKGLAVAKQITTQARESYQARLYAQLGENFLHQGGHRGLRVMSGRWTLRSK